VMGKFVNSSSVDLENILWADSWARKATEQTLKVRL
jgi:hypothetical protein